MTVSIGDEFIQIIWRINTTTNSLPLEPSLAFVPLTGVRSDHEQIDQGDEANGEARQYQRDIYAGVGWPVEKGADVDMLHGIGLAPYGDHFRDVDHAKSDQSGGTRRPVAH